MPEENGFPSDLRHKRSCCNFASFRIPSPSFQKFCLKEGANAATDGVTRKHLVAFQIVQHLEGTIHDVQAVSPLPQMRWRLGAGGGRGYGGGSSIRPWGTNAWKSV
jgi:hypothetical protein